MQRFAIQLGARLHVVRDIGDGHIEHIALGRATGIYRIVEVTRISAIDGDQWQVAQVTALGMVRRAHFGRDRGRLVQYRPRPF